MKISPLQYVSDRPYFCAQILHKINSKDFKQHKTTQLR